MDKLAEQLRQDAERIDASVSDELEHRIEASLRAVVQDQPDVAAPTPRSARFWWASSLTGVAAAAALIAVINNQQTTMPTVDPANSSPQASVYDVPAIQWRTEAAVLTQPLQQELEDLQSDLKKAEEKIREDIGL